MLQRQFSAGGVVYRKEKENIFWLLAKSAPSSDYPKPVWRLQKGWIDDEKEGKPGPIAKGGRKAKEEELQMAALREVREEGGVLAKIIKKIETTKFFFTAKDGQRILKFVTYYLMEWQIDSEEGYGFETLEVRWLPYEEARKTLSINGEKKILDKAKEILDSGIQPSLI